MKDALPTELPHCSNQAIIVEVSFVAGPPTRAPADRKRKRQLTDRRRGVRRLSARRRRHRRGAVDGRHTCDAKTPILQRPLRKVKV